MNVIAVLCGLAFLYYLVAHRRLRWKGGFKVEFDGIDDWAPAFLDRLPQTGVWTDRARAQTRAFWDAYLSGCDGLQKMVDASLLAQKAIREVRFRGRNDAYADAIVTSVEEEAKAWFSSYMRHAANKCDVYVRI